MNFILGPVLDVAVLLPNKFLNHLGNGDPLALNEIPLKSSEWPPGELLQDFFGQPFWASIVVTRRKTRTNFNFMFYLCIKFDDFNRLQKSLCASFKQIQFDSRQSPFNTFGGVVILFNSIKNANFADSSFLISSFQLQTIIVNTRHFSSGSTFPQLIHSNNAFL
jgi:hypothetical protein